MEILAVHENKLLLRRKIMNILGRSTATAAVGCQPARRLYCASPHTEQNFAPGIISALHFLHPAPIFSPHSGQNFAVPGI